MLALGPFSIEMPPRTLLGFVRIEVAVCDNSGSLANGNSDNAND